MALFIKNIASISKYPLRFSYRFINDACTNQRDELTEENSEDDDNLPINLDNNPFERERKLCILCRLKIIPDYKNVRLLSQFQSPYTGKIYGKHITGLCAHKQSAVETEVFKAQSVAMMPDYNKNPIYTHDPKLYDPDNPFRPHKY